MELSTPIPAAPYYGAVEPGVRSVSGSDLLVATAQANASNNLEVTAKQPVNRSNFKVKLKEYCFKDKTFGQKLSNLMTFIFLSIANFFKPNYAVSCLNGRVKRG